MVPLGKGLVGKNKKSDWTMDMPKTLEYKRPADDESEGSDNNELHSLEERLDENEFLSDEDNNEDQKVWRSMTKRI